MKELDNSRPQVSFIGEVVEDQHSFVIVEVGVVEGWEIIQSGNDEVAVAVKASI